MEKEKSFIAWLYDATTNGPIPKMVLSNRTREKLLQYHYARSHDGKELNLKNPQTFTEKIAWYKIFYDNKNFEKYLSRKNLGKGTLQNCMVLGQMLMI